MPDSDGYVSDLARELAADALERFLRYVRIDTQSDPHAGTYPSTEKQLDLSRLLVDELRAIGLEDAELTEGSVVMATIPATTDREVPAFGLIAHVVPSEVTSSWPTWSASSGRSSGRRTCCGSPGSGSSPPS